MRLSIIIPVYNLEKCIGRTLDSCLMQDLDMEEYEILCVDDGSKDKSLDILNEYSKTHPNIHVISKENGGVSSARNKGLEVAKGEYVWFVDGDDVIRANCLDFIVKTMDSENADLLMHDIKITHDEKEKYDYPIGNISYKKVDGVTNIYDTCKRSYGGGAWSYIFRRAICDENGLEFPTDMKYSEDLLFVFLYKSYCKTAIIVNEYFYCYIMRSTSAIHNIDYSHHIYCFERCIAEYSKVGANYINETNYFDHKINVCVKGIITDLVAIADIDYAKNVFADLKSRGLYPVGNDFYAVRNLKSIKSRLLALRAIICTYEPICFFIIRIKNLFRKGK